MIQGNVAAPSRWVLRALWLIALILAAVVLSVRSNNILSQSQQMLDGLNAAAALSFAVPTESRDVPHSLDAFVWPGHKPLLLRTQLVATVVAGTPLTLSGWAFDPRANAPFAAIGAKIDDRPEIGYSVLKIPRDDVAAVLRTARARDSGFSTSIDTRNLALGPHTIALRALSPNEKTAVALGTVDFAIGSQDLAAQKTDSFDAINGVLIRTIAQGKLPIAVTRSARRITLVGWGFITNGRRLASSAVLLLDGNPVAPVRYGLPRADVANAYRDVRVSRSGFEVSLPLDTVPIGVHELKIRMNSNDGSIVDSASTLRIDVRGYL